MILESLTKATEPVTLITDLLLFFQGLIYGILLLMRAKKKAQTAQNPLFWILTFLSIGIFALCGAISHGTPSVAVADLFWPPTVIFGGLAFFFFNIAVMIMQQPRPLTQVLRFPLILLVIYIVGLILADWAFILFVAYQLVCSVIIFILSARTQNEHIKPTIRQINFGLVVLLIAGGVQAVGSILGWRYYFGDDAQYLFQPHNDIFHIIAMYGVYLIYRAVVQALK
jgi:hypothetical protein